MKTLILVLAFASVLMAQAPRVKPAAAGPPDATVGQAYSYAVTPTESNLVNCSLQFTRGPGAPKEKEAAFTFANNMLSGTPLHPGVLLVMVECNRLDHSTAMQMVQINVKPLALAAKATPVKSPAKQPLRK
jgi:hypothetical protein